MRIRVLLLLTSVLAAPALAQRGIPPSPARYTIELVQRDRWLNARQQSINSPTTSVTTRVFVDSITTDSVAGLRKFWMQTGSLVNGDPASVVTSLDGRTRSIDGALRPRPPLPAGLNRDTASLTNFRILDFSRQRLTLPATRVWDVIPSVHPPRLVAGAQWSDTVNLVSTFGANRQSLTGIRRSRIERDTTVNGRSLWIVRDSLAAQFDEQFGIDERTMASTVTMERRTRGFIRGRYLYDPSIALARSREDTVALAGDAVLGYADGRRYTTTTRLERKRAFTLYEPAELAAHDSELRAQREAGRSGGVVSVPVNRLQTRLSSGDARAIDSLTRTWRASRNADQRDSIYDLVRMWTRRDTSIIRAFDRERIASGDTAFMYEHFSGATLRPLTVEAVRFLLPFMRDPGLALQFNVSRDLSYEAVTYALRVGVPAFEPDSTKWSCEPAACRMIASEWNVAREPRLRSAALAMLTMTDPRRWYGVAIARIDSGDRVLGELAPVVKAYGSAVPANQLLPLPASGADWRAWRDWIGVRRPDATAPPPGMRPLPPPWLNGRVNADGIRFHRLATGRDVTNEIQAMYRAQDNDTARVVLGRILIALSALTLPGDSVAAMMKSNSPLIQDFARQLVDSYGPNRQSAIAFAPMDRAASDSIQQRLLDGMLAQKDSWRSLEEKQGRAPARFAPPPTDASRNATHPIYVANDSLRIVVRTDLNPRAAALSAAAWNAKSNREAGELWTVSRAEQSGAFIRITLSVAGRLQRTEAQAPSLWYSGTTYLLMNYDGEWVIVSKSAWVT